MLKNARVITSCFFVVILLTGFFLATAAKADPRLEMFLQKYADMKGKRLPFAHRDNPFYPYLKKPFEDGLEARDKAELRLLQEKGICGLPVYRLVIKGFLQLYPHLKPAFQDKTKGPKLEFMVTSSNRGPIIRCINYQSLIELRARRSLADFPPIDMAAGVASRWGKGGTGRERRPETDQDILFYVQFSFGRTAFCLDYPLSIKDVMASANKPGGMMLTTDEELYLTERARLHGLLNGSKYRQAIEKLRQGSLSPQQFQQILMASRKFSLRDIAGVKGFWQPTCKEVFNRPI